MSVRTDITVDFDVSPRIITVAAPSTDLAIQDLWDTLRQFEDELPYLSFYALISNKSGGKISLGAGEFTGISLVLNDAKLAFEARAGPTWDECQITGGNLIAVDAGAVIMWPIEATNYVNVAFRQSTAPALVGSADLELLRKLLMNRLITDPVAHKITLYDDDDSTVLLEADLWEDAAGTEGYRGQGTERRDRLE